MSSDVLNFEECPIPDNMNPCVVNSVLSENTEINNIQICKNKAGINSINQKEEFIF